jgi:uncharacterized repeat protein (TIGR03847 family)
MASERNDFGAAELLDAEAIGQPGNRRFRLFALSRRGRSASLWMEREQMEALAVAIDGLLAQVSGQVVLRPEAQAVVAPAPHAPAEFPKHPDVEFQVGRMQIGYDEEDDRVVLRASPLEVVERNGELEVNEEVAPAFAVSLTQAHATRLSIHISAVLSGGRPRCPLCGQPMRDGHVCAKQNGYHPVGLN